MGKPEAQRVYDPETRSVHYEADGLGGNVTLCGQTDWLGQSERGRDTARLVDCAACVSVVAFIQSHNFKGTSAI